MREIKTSEKPFVSEAHSWETELSYCLIFLKNFLKKRSIFIPLYST